MNIVERFLTKSPSKKMLRFVCIIGLILSALISIPLLIVSIVHARGNPLQETNIIRTNPFVESLNEFDYVFAQNRTSPEVGRLDAILNRAEEHAAGVDAHLSVLKRRRILAKAVPEYRLQYRNAVSRVLEQFPYSENISIVAGDAVLLHKEELDQQDQNDLLHYAKNISVRQNTKNPLILLGFYVFEGSARNLLTARQIPQAAEIFTSAIDYVGKAEQPNLVTASAILQILAGNQNAAINLINKYKTTLLEQSRSAWFMVEALYDFDDPSAAASILGIEDYPFVNSQSIIRLSDALYRMNNINDARFFWNLLLVPENETESVPHPEGTVPSTMLEKSLYNLAITCASDDEKRSYLEELLKISPDHIPGIILYSRLLNYDEAISMLQKTIGKNKNDLIELELIRQNRRYSEPGKTAADTWLLLGRYPADANLYHLQSIQFSMLLLSSAINDNHALNFTN
ncbi:MAG: hypothetical protein LBV20_08035 [Treponema sp.]|jgi:tetratricopeptide (TPR) repeat protein|nr:hypothetical protein [Treponema sp.]